MGFRYQSWFPKTQDRPTNYAHLSAIVQQNRSFEPVSQLQYGDYGLESALRVITSAIRENRKIALYADYDVDGTMSCVSWIWFFEAIGFTNFVHYIPDRFKEGYGVNLTAIQHLVQDHGAQVVITMDTGITANVEAQWCLSQGVDFICTDHHVIQPEKMPNCVILNPKLHPDAQYQELCGCGITFVLLRKLGQVFGAPAEVWTDILALTGMATICDVVPLNGVNHKLAQQGVQALFRSKREVFVQLLRAAKVEGGQVDEKDIGFRLGPRINAVGRLEHANQVIEAFVKNDPSQLIEHMGVCNEKRKQIQTHIVKEARILAEQYPEDAVLFLGGDWHIGVVGIAASKIAEQFWRPVWLFHRSADGMSKGSARSIPGFDVTSAMASVKDLFFKFGGHKAAGGFTFPTERESDIRKGLLDYAEAQRLRQPELWRSSIRFDCHLPISLAKLELADHLSSLKPFGHGFEEPVFLIETPLRRVTFLKDKQTNEPKHTSVEIPSPLGGVQKIMFFNEVYSDLADAKHGQFLVSASKNFWNGQHSLSLMGIDFEC